MSREAQFHARLRTFATHPAARGLVDDAAQLSGSDGPLVLTTDTMVETIHYLPDDPPADIGWKLAAVNLSDLAAKGARPVGCLLNYALGPDAGWDAGFLDGLGDALARFDLPLLGGDTVAMPAGAPRSLTLTAIGAQHNAPSRASARPGDLLWVTGTIGDAGAGLAIARGEAGPAALLDRYRRPVPRLAEGVALAPHVQAMMDVSDGLLIDAARMAQASACRVAVDLAMVPRSAALSAFAGTDCPALLASAVAGDDYELLFALPPAVTPQIAATRIGSFCAGAGIELRHRGEILPLPARLGFEHG